MDPRWLGSLGNSERDVRLSGYQKQVVLNLVNSNIRESGVLLPAYVVFWQGLLALARLDAVAPITPAADTRGNHTNGVG